MATDVRPASQHASEADRSAHRQGPKPPNVILKVAFIGFAVIAAPAAVVAFFSSSIWPADTGPMLTHTVRPGKLVVSVTEQGTLESSNNTEITCKVRGFNTVTWVIPSGSVVQPGDELASGRASCGARRREPVGDPVSL